MSNKDSVLQICLEKMTNVMPADISQGFSIIAVMCIEKPDKSSQYEAIMFSLCSAYLTGKDADILSDIQKEAKLQMRQMMGPGV